MRLFSKKKKKICFIKTTELVREGWKIHYHTEIDDIFIRNSMYSDRESAQAFYDKVLEQNGVTKLKETLQEAYR